MRRADAEDVEIVARYVGGRHDFGGCALLAGDGEGQRAGAAVSGDDAGVGLIVIADVNVVRVVEGCRGLLGIAGDDGELLRRAYGQGAQHDVIDEGEDGRVGADSERQGEYGHRGEGGVLGDEAKCVTDICKHAAPPES